MRKLTFTLATAACALIVSACQDATEPVALEGSGGSGNDTQCVGTLGVGPFDNIVVPPGQFCLLNGSQVKGNVLVKENATLQANASTIGGNVQGDKSTGVLLQFQTRLVGNFDVKGGSQSNLGVTGFDILVRVGGDAKIEENRGYTFVDAAIVGGNLEVLKSTGFLEIEFNTVGGNIKIEDNTPTGMSAIFNQVRGDMQVFKNGGPGFKRVAANTVRQNLQCKENTPIFIGGPNAAGKAEDQCFIGPF